MEKDLNISRLCDVYGSLLTEHRREIVRSYYDYDLSLAEIAENFGITRQAALCSIRQAEEKLNGLEEKLGIMDKSDRLVKELNELYGKVVGNSDAQSTIARLMRDFG